MPSLTDLGSVFGQNPPAGFNLGEMQLQGDLGQITADEGRRRLLRNFSQFNLPDLVSSQAARGAFRTSATRNKANRLATGTQDQLGDIQLGLAAQQAGLATNSLLAQTGISLGGY